MDILFRNSNSQEIVGAKNQSEIISYDLIGAPAGIPKVAHGVLTHNSNGTYTYTPNTGFFGIEKLSFDNGQSMSLLVGPPTGKGLKDVAEGVQTIGTTISNILIDGTKDPKSDLTNKELEAVDSREFSHYTLENNAKWEQFGNSVDIDGDGKKWEFQYFDSKLQELEDIAVQAKELGSKVNLHAVLWNQPGHQPEHIVTRYNQEIVQGNNGVVTDEFRVWFEGQIGTHVDTLLNVLGNSVDIIDVVNEHIFSDFEGNTGLYHKFYDKPTDYIKAAFAQTGAAIARYNNSHTVEEQIDARLAINDFNVLYRFDENKYDPESKTEEVKADIYYNMIKGLIADGVEIDVVGFQSHMVVDRINRHIGKNTDNDDLNDNIVPTGAEIYDAILSNLQRFIDLGVEIIISELDVRTHLNVVDKNGDIDNENSDFTKIYEVIGALAHDIPEITDVILWGTTHRASWLKDFENDPLLFNNNYNREDEYYAFMEGLTGNSEYNRAETGETNRNPHAKDDDGYTIIPGGSATIDVLGNDKGRDGDPLAVTHINGTALNEFGWSNYIEGVGLIHRNGDGSITQYALDTPNGTTSFNYTVSDGQGGANTATVTGSIGQVQNNNPVAVNNSGYTIVPGSSAILDVLGNDSDADGDVLVVTHINGVELNQFGWSNYIPYIGMIKRNSDGSLTQYSLDAPTGDFTFEYTVSDGNGGTASATVTGKIDRGFNTNPVANNDTGHTIDPGQSATIDVLGNDTDADGDLLTVTHINGTQLSDRGWTDYISGVGIVQRTAEGTLTHYAVDTPAGVSSFEYTVSDGFGGTASATVAGTIAPATVGTTANGTSPGSSTSPSAVANTVVSSTTSTNASPPASPISSPPASPPASPPVSPTTNTSSNSNTAVATPNSQTTAQTNSAESAAAGIPAPTARPVENNLQSSVITPDSVIPDVAVAPADVVVAQPNPSEFIVPDITIVPQDVTQLVPDQDALFTVENSAFNQAELALSDEFFI